MGMLITQLVNVAVSKWERATEPLIDHHRQCILIAGKHRLTGEHLWSHVGGRAWEICGGLHCRSSRLGHHSNAEVTEQEFALLVNQHVVRFDVAVDNVVFVMRVLQSIGNLCDVFANGSCSPST